MKREVLEEQIIDYVVKNKENHYRLAYSYVKNVDDSLDIVQESIFKAFSSINSLNDLNNIKTWFYRIIINTALDFLRKRKKIVILDEEILGSSDCLITDDVYEDIDLQKALEELPDNYRIVVVLRFFEDLKIEEIAEVLNENVNTVKTRLYKSLQKLRIKMNDEG